MIVELKNIYKNYGDGEAEVRVLKDVTMSVREGEYLAVMGPSGSGKSTLMNILGCLDRPTSGTYLLDGQDVSSLSENELASVRLNKIGFVFQTFQLLPGETAAENVALPLIYAGVPKEERLEREAESRHSEGDDKRAETPARGRAYRSARPGEREAGHGFVQEAERRRSHRCHDHARCEHRVKCR